MAIHSMVVLTTILRESACRHLQKKGKIRPIQAAPPIPSLIVFFFEFKNNHMFNGYTSAFWIRSASRSPKADLRSGVPKSAGRIGSRTRDPKSPVHTREPQSDYQSHTQSCLPTLIHSILCRRWIGTAPLIILYCFFHFISLVVSKTNKHYGGRLRAVNIGLR